MDKPVNKKRKANVVITETNLRVLEFIATYYIVSRRMVQEALFSHCNSPKAIVTRLKKLRDNGFIARAAMQVVPDGQNPRPIYHLTKKGAKALAAGRQNSDWLNVNLRPPSNFLLWHWLGIVNMHVMIDAAIAVDAAIKMCAFHKEWEVINKDQPNPKLHFSLHTTLRSEPPLSVAPDFGFMLESQGFKKVYLGEYDRATDSIRRIARKKTPGYAYLANHGMHAKHFPEGGKHDFAILMITQTEFRRDELANKLSVKERPDLWRFALESDLSPESFFRLPVWRKCDGSLVRLLVPPWNKLDLCLFVVSCFSCKAYDGRMQGHSSLPNCHLLNATPTRKPPSRRDNWARAPCIRLQLLSALHNAAIASQIVSPTPDDGCFNLYVVSCLMWAVSQLIEGSILRLVSDSQKA